MRVLITRPRDDAEPLSDMLRSRGYECVIEPLLAVDFSLSDNADLPAHAALLLTSANGARALARATGDRSKPVYAVGDATAREARGLGFTDVTSAGGDVDDLAALVARSRQPGDGHLLHVAGKHVAGDLPGLLAARGFTVARRQLYEVDASTRFSPEVESAFVRDDIDAVLLFSPRTAKTFNRLAANGGAGRQMRNCLALCLSDAVADAVAGLSWRGVHVAAAPTQDALVERLEQVCPPGGADQV
jgi:uroporphyrinogen-III synthase